MKTPLATRKCSTRFKTARIVSKSELETFPVTKASRNTISARYRLLERLCKSSRTARVWSKSATTGRLTRWSGSSSRRRRDRRRRGGVACPWASAATTAPICSSSASTRVLSFFLFLFFFLVWRFSSSFFFVFLPSSLFVVVPPGFLAKIGNFSWDGRRRRRRRGSNHRWLPDSTAITPLGQELVGPEPLAAMARHRVVESDGGGRGGEGVATPTSPGATVRRFFVLEGAGGHLDRGRGTVVACYLLLYRSTGWRRRVAMATSPPMFELERRPWTFRSCRSRVRMDRHTHKICSRSNFPRFFLSFFLFLLRCESWLQLRFGWSFFVARICSNHISFHQIFSR